MPLTYVNYARRSSDESSKKQAQSIEDQLQDTRRIQRELGLDVVAELTESRTAKEPGRPVFNQMIQMIEKGEVNAILCWKLDRLARNPIDAATLRWLMRKGKLLEIRTPYQTYHPEDNAVITAVENAMAEQYIIDLKKGVERGMKSKCEKGGYPLHAPSGYLNNRMTRSVEIDETCFPLLRRAWELLLSGNASVPEIHDRLINHWGYRNPPGKGRRDGCLSLSGLYDIFKNPFYMGTFQFQGTTYVHNFPRMVTKEEWDQAQRLLKRRGHKRATRHSFAFTGLITCASCGYLVTAEKTKGHTYYHCNNRLGICSKKGIREERIDEQVSRLLASIEIGSEFAEFAIDVLADLHDQEVNAHQAILARRQQLANDLKRKQEALLNLYLEGHLTSGEYAQKKQELARQEIESKLDGGYSNDRVSKADESVVKALRFASSAATLFLCGEPEMKRQIAREVGHRYIMNNGELQVDLNPLFEPVRLELRNASITWTKIEPLKIGSDKWEVRRLEPAFQRWYRWVERYRTLLLENSFPAPVPD